MRTDERLRVTPTPIPGLLRIDLAVHADARGWFKENWQRAKMVALGLPDFGPVQQNISFNHDAGVTRGIHAEPWDKFVSVATGRVFGAWVDLREGENFGVAYTCEIDPSVAIYVPAGVGNAYQTLEAATAYSYMVNRHWSPNAKYTFVNLADETAGINWPIPLDQTIRSDKDLAHPSLSGVAPFTALDAPRRRVLVIGATGQLGIELMRQLPGHGFRVTGIHRPEFDLTNAQQVADFDWSAYDTVVNAAAWTNVDAAETPEGRHACWLANAVGTAHLAKAAITHGLTLVHVSSEYVFDGARSTHTEDEPPSPLGVYGQSKAAGDMAVTAVPQHYLVRTSWVIGDGKNFVETMAELAEKGIDPTVVDDQNGRLTFAVDLAAGIIHLLNTRPESGTYNLTNAGEVMSWHQVATRVFELTGHDPTRVRRISTKQYFANKQAAPRPLNSTLELGKIEATGFAAADADQRLQEYLGEMRRSTSRSTSTEPEGTI